MIVHAAAPQQPARPVLELRLKGAAAALCLALCAIWAVAGAPAAAAAASTGRSLLARPSPADRDSHYLALCAAVKDRPGAVREWVEYHLALGVSKIYLMDTDDPEAGAMAATLQVRRSSCSPAGRSM